MEWKTIDTARRDGTHILVMHVHCDTQIVHNGFWLEDDYIKEFEPEQIGWWSYDKSEVSRIKLEGWLEPKYWCELPALTQPKQ